MPSFTFNHHPNRTAGYEIQGIRCVAGMDNTISRAISLSVAIFQETLHNCDMCWYGRINAVQARSLVNISLR